MPLLREGPGWLVTNALTTVQIRALRRLRHFRYHREDMVAVPDPKATDKVDTAAITRAVPLSRFEASFLRTLLATVGGGDWDRDLPRVEGQQNYRTFRAHVEGIPWLDTVIIVATNPVS